MSIKALQDGSMADEPITVGDITCKSISGRGSITILCDYVDYPVRVLNGEGETNLAYIRKVSCYTSSGVKCIQWIGTNTFTFTPSNANVGGCTICIDLPYPQLIPTYDGIDSTCQHTTNIRLGGSDGDNNTCGMARIKVLDDRSGITIEFHSSPDDRTRWQDENNVIFSGTFTYI